MMLQPVDPSGLNLSGLNHLDLDPLLLEFATYWKGLPKKGLVPDRVDFLPTDIPHLLPHLTIHELLSTDFIQLRLVGTAIENVYGQNMTGKNYLDFIPPSGRVQTSKAIHLSCEHPVAMVFHTKSTTKKGTLLERQSIAFPMRSGEGPPRLIYFCTITTNPRPYADQQREQLVINDVSISFIDIGAGIPDIGTPTIGIPISHN